MLIVAALGGNALLQRGDSPVAEIQEHHVIDAVHSLSAIARDHTLVITHGNGPQVGLLALESATDPLLPSPYPFDALGAQTQGMIGYWLLQAFENAFPTRQVAALITQSLVSADDKAFDTPTKFIGPCYSEDEAHRLAELHRWSIRQDGNSWRRVVASPEPMEIIEMQLLRTLSTAGSLVICAGGGGIPVQRDSSGRLFGVEAVIDKDLASSLIARELNADLLLLLTDVSSVMTDFGTDHQVPIRSATAAKMRSESFPTGSMGPKIEAACRFVEATGNRAAIGQLTDAESLLKGTAGTVVTR